MNISAYTVLKSSCSEFIVYLLLEIHLLAWNCGISNIELWDCFEYVAWNYGIVKYGIMGMLENFDCMDIYVIEIVSME